MKKYLIIFILLITIGCQQNFNIANTNIAIETSLNTSQNYQTEWQELKTGLNFKEMPVYSSTNKTIVNDVIAVFKFQPDKFNFVLKQQTEEPLSVFDWQKKYQPLFVCNGGYFLENNKAAELLKIDGEHFGTNLNSDSVGEFVINDNGQADILVNADQKKYNNILQSYPLLIRPDNQTAIKDDSGQAATRTVIAVDQDNNILFIFTKNYYFSLYQLQNYLHTSDLNIKTALNLDGGPSSSYYYAGENNKISSGAEIPNVIMVFAK